MSAPEVNVTSAAAPGLATPVVPLTTALLSERTTDPVATVTEAPVVLDAVGLTKIFGGVAVLEDVSLRLL